MFSKVVGVLLAAMLVFFVVAAAYGLIIWIDVDRIAGIDLSFREVAGFGLLAAALAGAVNTKSS